MPVGLSKSMPTAKINLTLKRVSIQAPSILIDVSATGFARAEETERIQSMQKKTGLWLLGARGSVASTVCIGLAALQKADNAENPALSAGLVSQLPEFQSLNLLDWVDVVVGGYEIRDVSLADEARQFASSSRSIDMVLLDQVSDSLKQMDQNILPGVLANSGERIDSLASKNYASTGNPIEQIERVRNDLTAFREQHDLERVIVVNVASTEPSVDMNGWPDSWSEFETRLKADEIKLPSSSIYAVAAFQAGCSFANFTPSLGSNFPAAQDLAIQNNVCHAGQDGKTGETLCKAAIAPMFAHRNLQVMSWVGHNIFGNMDARVLDDPANKQSKVESKDNLLGQILGYNPQTLVSIENIESIGDWKTAWDHIHFRGFLCAPMVMQFTWQGCDSILAAPLVLDLFRFVERAHRAGQSGILESLACFFKSPMQSTDSNISEVFSLQFQDLQNWAKSLAT